MISRIHWSKRVSKWWEIDVLTYNVRCGCRNIEYADAVSDNSETTMSPCEMSWAGPGLGAALAQQTITLHITARAAKMGLQIVLLSLILEFRRETHSKCPRTSENKSFIPVSIGIFMVAQHPSVYKQNSDCAIHPICSRSRQNLHRSSSYSQLASHSLLATQRIFCIFNSKAREWGLLGC